MSGFNKREFSIDLYSEDDDFDNDEPPEPGEIELEYNKIIEQLTQRNTVKNSGEKRKKQKKNLDSPVIANAQKDRPLDLQQRLDLGRDALPMSRTLWSYVSSVHLYSNHHADLFGRNFNWSGRNNNVTNVLIHLSIGQ